MFAPRVATTQTRGDASSTDRVGQRTSRQTGNERDGGHEREIVRENLTDLAAPRHLGWDFGKIPLFAPDQTSRTKASQPLPGIIQPKLTVGAVNDPLEHEADRVADQVMRMPDPRLSVAAAPPQVSRKCAACEEDEKNTLQTKSAATAKPVGEAPDIVHEVLRSPGQPLDSETRDFFERRFRRGFGDVRVHVDIPAAQSAQAVEARAYAVGRHIAFARGEFAPRTLFGRALLAHELTHVAQQGGAPNPASLPTADPSAPSELATEAHAYEPTIRIAGAGGDVLSRASVKIGNVAAEIDYGDLINIPSSGFLTAIQSRYRGYTGADLSTTVVAQISAFTPRQQEWVLFGLDILSENANRAPGLDRNKAFQLLVERAPAANTRGIGTSSLAFEREVLTVSGWSEQASVAKLKADYDAAVKRSDWLKATEFLNGFNETDVKTKLEALGSPELTAMEKAAGVKYRRVSQLAHDIIGQRLVGAATARVGKLYWAGPSGPDPDAGFQIKETDIRPTNTGQGTETNVNDFATWVRGGPAPTDASKMNCWEAVLYFGFKAGVISKAWIVDLHTRAAAAGRSAGFMKYFNVLEQGLNVPAAVPLSATAEPKAGDLVFFDKLVHVGLSTGTKNSAGNHEIISLWILPGSGISLLVSTLQRTTIEDINASHGALLHKPAMSVTFAPHPW